MTDFAAHWNSILDGDHKDQVDILVSLHEKGMNHFLKRTHEIDSSLPENSRKFQRTFERTFDTFGDERKFKITLALTKPMQIKLPPFTDQSHLSKGFLDKKKGWNAYDYHTGGPELMATGTEDENLVEIAAPGVSVKIEWPNLDTGKPPHSWVIPPFQVIGQAALQLDREGDDFFVTIIPKFIKIDIERPSLAAELKSYLLNADPSDVKLLDDCEDKFVDLFIIAANIAAYEQTPKLVTSVKLPVPVIQERPIQPAMFDISRNIMTMGFGIDKIALEKHNETELNVLTGELDAALNKDIRKAGGLMNVAYTNAGSKLKSIRSLTLREEREQNAYFTETDQFTEELNTYIDRMNDETYEEYEVPEEALLNEQSFAIGINEYFFDTIVDSVIPKPKNKCEKEQRVGPLKGYVCHWTAFKDPDIRIGNNASFTGSVGINIGGSIHACIKKFWDCSWRWACSKLAMSVVGRPAITIKIIKADGVRIAAKLDQGGLHLATNLPFPFNEIIKFFSSIVLKFLVAFANVLAALLSFYVVKPEFTVETLSLKLQLKGFDDFYFERTAYPSGNPTKNRFIGYKTDLAIVKA